MKNVFLLAIGIVFLTSCGNREKEVTVHFELTSTGAHHQLGDTIYAGDTAVVFDLFHLYLSNLAIDGEVLEPAWFINTSDSLSTTIKLPLKKNATTFSFGLGLDEVQNAFDPTSFEIGHPLSSANAMYWSWASKYRFVKAEGRLNYSGQLGADDQLLIWHTGLDTLYRTKTLDLAIEPGNTINVALDLDHLFSGVSLEKEVFTHTDVTDFDVAEAVTNQMIQSIEVDVR